MPSSYYTGQHAGGTTIYGGATKAASREGKKKAAKEGTERDKMMAKLRNLD